MRLKALWDYEAADESEISFKEGDMIEIVEFSNQDCTLLPSLT